MIKNYNFTVIMIVNYNRKTFIVEATYLAIDIECMGPLTIK